ncbi:MAG: hypothetical protein L0312_32610 [Acidobacteria bacterium]|nr:hypothetical protein [Acidobacteriota bacterium]
MELTLTNSDFSVADVLTRPIPNDSGQVQYFAAFAGFKTIILGPEVDLKAVADYTVTMPAGTKFWITNMGIISTAVNTLTIQPTVRFGVPGTLAKHLAAIITTLLTAVGKRQSYSPLVPQDGEASVTFGVTIGATATELKGRPWWEGFLVQDE